MPAMVASRQSKLWPPSENLTNTALVRNHEYLFHAHMVSAQRLVQCTRTAVMSSVYRGVARGPGGLCPPIVDWVDFFRRKPKMALPGRRRIGPALFTLFSNVTSLYQKCSEGLPRVRRPRKGPSSTFFIEKVHTRSFCWRPRNVKCKILATRLSVYKL